MFFSSPDAGTSNRRLHKKDRGGLYVLKGVVNAPAPGYVCAVPCRVPFLARARCFERVDGLPACTRVSCRARSLGVACCGASCGVEGDGSTLTPWYNCDV